jgi:hypothetical protein
MTLIRDTLLTELRKGLDEKYIQFTKHPSNLQEAGKIWSDAFSNYTKSIIPISTTVESAKGKFISTFNTITNTNGKLVFASCFQLYCVELGLGMQPLFTATPPPTLPIFDSVFTSGLTGSSTEICLEQICTVIDTWIRTGLAINNSSGVTVNWN